MPRGQGDDLFQEFGGARSVVELSLRQRQGVKRVGVIGLDLAGRFQFFSGLLILPRVEVKPPQVVVSLGQTWGKADSLRELGQTSGQVVLVGQRDSQIHVRVGRVGASASALRKFGIASGSRPVLAWSMPSAVYPDSSSGASLMAVWNCRSASA